MDIVAIEKSVMSADEATLKIMAESIPMDIWTKLSPEARRRLVDATGGKVAQTELPKPAGDITSLKEFSKLPEIEKKAIIEFHQRSAKGVAFSEREVSALLKNIRKENIEKYILKPIRHMK